MRLETTTQAVLLALLCVLPPGCHRPLDAVPPARATYPGATPAPRAPADQPAPPTSSTPAPAWIPGTPLDAVTLRRLVLAHHPDVATALAAEAEAEARTESAGAWPNPELGGRLLFDIADGTPGGEGAFLFQLPLGGRVGRAESVASLDLERARIATASTRLRVRLEAERLLAHLAHHRARLTLLSALAERSARYAVLARERRAASMADPLDVALVLADAARDGRAVARARAAVTTAEERLRVHAGLPPGSGELRTPRLGRPRLAETQDALVAASEQHRPALRQARLAVLRADAEAQLAAAERVPDLHLGPAVAGDPGGVSVGVQAGFPLPLLQSGGGPYAEALARRRAALAGCRGEARQAATEVVTLLARLRARDGELDALLGESLAVAKEAVELAHARFEAGQLDVLRLLSAHRAFADLKLDHLDLLLSRQEALIDLEGAVGRPLQVKKEETP